MDSVIEHYGLWSIVPPLFAIAAAFLTREPLTALLGACVMGLFIVGVHAGMDAGGIGQGIFWKIEHGIFGGIREIGELPGLFEESMGNAKYVWLLLFQLCLGVIIAFLKKNGAIEGFVNVMSTRLRTGAQVQLFAWLLGILIFFSDYFTPLFVGPVMRGLIDKAKVSREKLAYILDSTAAPKCVLIPVSEWGVFMMGLLIGLGPIVDRKLAMSVFIHAIPYNFYAILAVAMVGLIGAGILKDFGPMRKAEKRVLEEGKIYADGSTPMMSGEIDAIQKAGQIMKPRLFLNFALPIAAVVVYPFAFYIWDPEADLKILEGLMLMALVLGAGLLIQRLSIRELVETATLGIKGVIPAILILSLAFTINTITKRLGAAAFVIESTQEWLRPNYLPVLSFLMAAFISFSTGSSWGTYAILFPLSIPLAFHFSGNEVNMLSLSTIAAIAGGGVFGDHCSPLSDTTILSSLGAGSDHIDHVKTQLPYAMVVAALASVGYLIIGLL